MRSIIASHALCFATCCVLGGSAFARADAPVPHVEGELVIQFVAPPTEAMIAEVDAALGKPMWRAPRHAPHAKNRPGDAHPLSVFRIVDMGEGADLPALIRTASALPTVALATYNAAPEPTGFPDDPLLGDQWSHTMINTASAWLVSTGDTSIIVGVVDTGCRVTHEDLVEHVWVNDDPVNGVDDDGNGFIDDTYGWDFERNNRDVVDAFGHGTQVASIVGAAVDNGLGIAGIANLTVMTAKWWHSGGSDASVAEAVTYAVDNGAHVVNMSLSCPCEMPMTESALAYAEDNDVVVVASMGNGGSSTLHYPAAYDTSIAVSAVNISGGLPGFSSFGAHVDVAAPSPDILSCGATGDSVYDGGFRGTSASAPHVAGLAGLVRAVAPSLTAADVRTAIIENATDIGAAGFDSSFGHGRIDVGATVVAVAVTGCTADFDGNGSVDVVDLLTLLASWGPCPGCPADLDGTGGVDFADLLGFLAQWGPC